MCLKSKRNQIKKHTHKYTIQAMCSVFYKCQKMDQPGQIYLLKRNSSSAERLIDNDVARSEEIDKEAFMEAVRKLKWLWDKNDPSFVETKKVNA